LADAIMSRNEFPKFVKLAAWRRSGGRCDRCTAKLFAKHITYDHIVPDALGGKPTLENCQCLCDVCDDIKTNTGDGLQWGDKTRIAKAARIHEKRIGARDDRKRSTFQTNRDGPYKRTMRGELIRRHT
jgi:5-methylcytosine-specific restriction enzyme A